MEKKDFMDKKDLQNMLKDKLLKQIDLLKAKGLKMPDIAKALGTTYGSLHSTIHGHQKSKIDWWYEKTELLDEVLENL